MTTKRLIHYIKFHNFEARERSGKLLVLEQWTETKGEHEGMLQEEWIEIEPTFESVRAWLGY